MTTQLIIGLHFIIAWPVLWMILSPQIAGNGYKWMLISTLTAVAGFSFGTWVLSSMLPKTIQLIFSHPSSVGQNAWIYDANLSITGSFWSNIIIAIPWIITFLVVARVIIGFTFLLLQTRGFTKANSALRARLSILSAKAGISEPKLFVGKTKGIAFSTIDSIYLSNEVVEKLAPEKLDVVLAHEIAHIKNGDQISRWCHMIISSMTLIVPSGLFWQRFEYEIEKQADKLAASISGNNMIVAETLVSCARFLRTQPGVSNLSSHIDLLTKRVNSLIGKTEGKRRADWYTMILVLTLNLFLIIPSVSALEKMPEIEGLSNDQVNMLIEGQMAALIYKPYCADNYKIQFVHKDDAQNYNFKHQQCCVCRNCQMKSRKGKMEVRGRW